MKFAIVGMGVIGRIHAHVIRELQDAQLAAVVDYDAGRAEKSFAVRGQRSFRMC